MILLVIVIIIIIMYEVQGKSPNCLAPLWEMQMLLGAFIVVTGFGFPA